MNAKPIAVVGTEERARGGGSNARVVTNALMLVNFSFFIISVVVTFRLTGQIQFLDLIGPGFPMSVLDLLGGKDAYAIRVEGEWWRLVSAGMLHAGIFHLAMNSWVLKDVGPMVEEFFGSYRMALIYILGSIAGFTASSWWRPQSLSVGASAGICALIGAMIAYGYLQRSSIGIAIRNHFIQWMLYMLIIGLMITSIDQAAHIGGLIGGFAVAWIVGERRLFDDWKEKLIRGGFILTLIIVAYALVQMFRQLLPSAQG